MNHPPALVNGDGINLWLAGRVRELMTVGIDLESARTGLIDHRARRRDRIVSWQRLTVSPRLGGRFHEALDSLHDPLAARAVTASFVLQW
jgi:hypothetical protein